MRIALSLAAAVLVAGVLVGGTSARTLVDTTPPAIVLTVPTPNPCVSGTLGLSGTGTANAVTLSAAKGKKLLISAAITDAGGLATMELDVRQAGGTWYSTGAFSPSDLPWSASFPTGSAPDGKYEIKARATDASSNTSETAPVPFRICNKSGSGSDTATAAVGPEPARAGYCLNGKFYDLEFGQPDRDPAYKGAVPAIYIDGVGITCDPPTGRKDMGFDVDGTGAHPVPGAPPLAAAIYHHYE